MSESKRTPGPWHVEETGARLWVENEDGSHVVATVERDLGTVLPPELAEARANAGLIAAAPEMREAAAESVALIESEFGELGPDVIQQVASLLRAALSKARGGSEG